MIPVAAATAARFARDWDAATAGEAPGHALVALSGGADSSALLMLMASLPAVVVTAATVDHRLRAASSAEAVVAAGLARACGVPHAILAAPLPDRVERTANLSARARALRYRLLVAEADRLGARWIVTAHHADDQLETLVMRLNRGAGIRGLSGVRTVSDRIVRPLLGWRRDELAAVVAAGGWRAVVDPTNVDHRFDRARLRHRLAAVDWLDPVAAARSAAALAEADAALEWAADTAQERCCTRGEESVTVASPGRLPVEIRRRLVERALRHLDPDITLRGGKVGGLMQRLAEGQAATLGRVSVRPLADAAGSHGGGAWLFRRAPPHRQR